TAGCDLRVIFLAPHSQRFFNFDHAAVHLWCGPFFWVPVVKAKQCSTRGTRDSKCAGAAGPDSAATAGHGPEEVEDARSDTAGDSDPNKEERVGLLEIEGSDSDGASDSMRDGVADAGFTGVEELE